MKVSKELTREIQVKNKTGSKLFVLCLLLGAWGSAFAELTASVDRSRLNMGDSLTLSISSDEGEDLDDIDLSDLEANFIIAGTSSHSSYNFGSGQSTRTKQRELALFPRRNGRLEIPAFRSGRSSTQPITIDVQKADTRLDASKEVYVEAELDRDSTYVQAQLIYTFRLFHSIALEDSPQLTPLKLDDAVIEQIGSTSFQRQVQGRPFMVRELRYAVFPQKSGQLEIPSLTLTARTRTARRSMFQAGRGGNLISRQTPAFSVEVKPVPAQYPDAPWLPLSMLELTDDWSSPPQNLSVGDSATRTVTLTAQGVAGTLLPPLDLPTAPGIRIYPDQAGAESTNNENGITGLGINSAALLVTQPGKQVLPAIRIPWWDVDQQRVRYAVLGELELDVAAPPSPAGTEPLDSSVSTPAGIISGEPLSTTLPGLEQAGARLWMWMWMWISVVFALLWIATLLAWYRSGKATPQAATGDTEKISISEADSFRALDKVLSGGSDLQCREQLRAWGETYFELDSRPTLEQIGRWLEDDKVSVQLQQLELKLYTDSATDWQPKALKDALRDCRKQRTSQRGKTANTTLPALNS